MTRKTELTRKTSETDIRLSMNFDEYTRGSISTGSGFLDHMLDIFQVHSGIALELHCDGDTHIDMHHSAEDIAICFGNALNECVGDKKGIERYGFYYVPMDEALARSVVDFAGRIGFSYNVSLSRADIGNIDTELFKHFFSTVAENAKMNIHIDLIRGENTHHCLEAIFKSFARAVAMAIGPGRNKDIVPSSKGTL
ncbi:MAG: imidazoleglycerol-phosphate dehydratase HisB [Fibrobacterales bacterium]